MNLTIILNNGMQFTAQVENYDPVAFATTLNNNQVTVVNIGNVVLSRHAILMVVPTESMGEVPSS